jgi:hypothetical protein
MRLGHPSPSCHYSIGRSSPAVTQRAFIILLIVLAVAIALSATAFPGAMIGFLFGIGVAFFVAIPVAAIGKALDQAGIAVTGKQLAWTWQGDWRLVVGLPHALAQAGCEG